MPKFCLPALFAFLLGSVVSTLPLPAQDIWTWRSPSPTGNRLGSFAYGSGRFVGVGEVGEIATSPDGIAWATRESGVTDLLSHVAFGANRFVAISDSKTLTSTDGVTWTSQVSAQPLADLAFGNNLFVALISPANSTHGFLTSPDGAIWTLHATSAAPTRVLFANGVFVAPIADGSVLVSSDGRSWSSIRVTPALVNAPAFAAAGNDRFLVVFGTQAYLSTNGLNWENVTQTFLSVRALTIRVPDLGTQSSLGFAGGYFYLQQSRYATDSLSQYRSADGRTWTNLNPSLSNFDFNTLASGGGVSVATEINQLASILNSRAHVIHTSADGLGWTTRTATLENPAGAVSAPYLPRAVYGLGRFFYAGQSSPDGVTWGATGFEPTHAAGDLVFRLSSGPEAPPVRVSADGLTSAAVDVKIAQPRSVAFGHGVYVMIGGSAAALSTSTDGVNWTDRPLPTTVFLSEIIFAFDRFIAVGDEGTVITSPDGTTWTQLAGEPFKHFTLRHVVAGPDRVVIAGTALTADAVAGSVALPGGTPIVLTSSHAFSSLGYVGGGFIAAGISTPTDSSYAPAAVEVWKSPDGVVWTQVPLHLTALDRSFFATFGYPTLAVGPGSALLSTHLGAYASSTRSYPALLQTTAPSAAIVAPTITYAPVPVTVHRGEQASFAVGVSGTGPFTYQWFHGGVAVDGATGPALTFTANAVGDRVDYSVVVTNSAGTVISPPARLTVLSPVSLTITRQPVSGEVAHYAPLTLSVEVTGSGPVTYQWRRNAQPISGATLATFTIEAAPPWQDSAVGTYDVVVTAPYSTVTSNPVAVTWGGLTTSISNNQVRVPVGAFVSVTASASGAHPPFTYQWGLQSGAAIPDAVDALFTLTNVTGPRTDSYAVTITDSAGHHEYASFQLIVVPDGSASMSLVTQPVTQAAATGSDIHLSVTAPAGANYRYQWRRYGQPIPGATSAELTLANFTPSAGGQFDVVVYKDDYSAAIVSQSATVMAGSSHLANLSALGFAGTGEETFFQGFVLQGTVYRNLPVGPIIRSVGPGLIRLGVENVLADPQLSVLDATHAEIGRNDNWSSPPTLFALPADPAEMAMLGALPLDPGALDSALKQPAPNGGLFFVQATGKSAATGYVLNEIYAPDFPTLRLANLSARSRVGDRPLIAGFVIAGDIPLKVLIRGVGPALAGQGVVHPLANPKITLYRGGEAIHNNDNWSDARNLVDLRAAAQAVGAFALPDGSHDAAMLETLAPGVYSAHVTSADGSSGVALVEIYEVR